MNGQNTTGHSPFEARSTDASRSPLLADDTAGVNRLTGDMCAGGRLKLRACGHGGPRLRHRTNGCPSVWFHRRNQADGPRPG